MKQTNKKKKASLSNQCVSALIELVAPEAVRLIVVLSLLLPSHLLVCSDTSPLIISHLTSLSLTHRACGWLGKCHNEGDSDVWADGCGGALQGWMDCEGPHPASHPQIQETSGAGTLLRDSLHSAFFSFLHSAFLCARKKPLWWLLFKIFSTPMSTPMHRVEIILFVAKSFIVVSSAQSGELKNANKSRNKMQFLAPFKSVWPLSLLLSPLFICQK